MDGVVPITAMYNVVGQPSDSGFIIPASQRKACFSSYFVTQKTISNIIWPYTPENDLNKNMLAWHQYFGKLLLLSVYGSLMWKM